LAAALKVSARKTLAINVVVFISKSFE